MSGSVGVLKTSGLVFAIIISVALGFVSAYGWTHLPRIVAQWTLDPNDKMAYPEIYQLIKHRHCTLLKRHPNYNEAMYEGYAFDARIPYVRMKKEGVCFEKETDLVFKYFQEQLNHKKLTGIYKRFAYYYIGNQLFYSNNAGEQELGKSYLIIAAYKMIDWGLLVDRIEKRLQPSARETRSRFSLEVFEYQLRLYHVFLGAEKLNPFYKELIDNVISVKGMDVEGALRSLTEMYNTAEMDLFTLWKILTLSEYFTKINEGIWSKLIYSKTTPNALFQKHLDLDVALYDLAAKILIQNEFPTFLASINEWDWSKIKAYNYDIVDAILDSESITVAVKAQIIINRLKVFDQMTLELFDQKRVLEDNIKLGKMGLPYYHDKGHLSDLLNKVLSDPNYRDKFYKDYTDFIEEVLE